jgi:hypothetical protein
MSYRCGNHSECAERVRRVTGDWIRQILFKCGLFKFDEKSHRIRVDFAQNPRFISNDSFKPVC